MPQILCIRHLPGNGGKLLDEKQLPNNHYVLNPSISYPILYIRGIKHTQFGEENYIILHNLEKNITHNIAGLNNILNKNVNTYTGLEDLRIIHYNNKLWFTATSTHAGPSMNSEMVIGYFNNNLTNIDKISYIPFGKPPIKNICPIIYDNKLCLIDIYKKEIYEVVDKNTDYLNTNENTITDKTINFDIKIIKKINCGNGIDIDNLKGSTNPIHLHGNLYGCIVHNAIFNDDNMNAKLAYMHYWIEIDMNLGQVTYISSPFWVLMFGIEFISGIRKDGDTIELYIGLQDKEAIKYVTSLAFLRSGK